MKDDKQIISQLSDLMPELFDRKNHKPTPGGICTPGSGCGPSTAKVETDIIKILAPNAPPSAGQDNDDPKNKTGARENK